MHGTFEFISLPDPDLGLFNRAVLRVGAVLQGRRRNPLCICKLCGTNCWNMLRLWFSNLGVPGLAFFLFGTGDSTHLSAVDHLGPCNRTRFDGAFLEKNKSAVL